MTKPLHHALVGTFFWRYALCFFEHRFLFLCLAHSIRLGAPRSFEMERLTLLLTWQPSHVATALLSSDELAAVQAAEPARKTTTCSVGLRSAPRSARPSSEDDV